jgi:DNA ligase-1
VPGKGRNRGVVGSLRLVLPNGVTVNVGSGLSDAQRRTPPALGTIVIFRYQELTDAGVPRFPTFVGVRAEKE